MSRATTRVMDYEKEELLKDSDTFFESTSIDMGLVLVTLILSITLSMMVLVKVYLANSIYIESVKIAKLNEKYYSLKEEGEDLSLNIEKINFKNRINH